MMHEICLKKLMLKVYVTRSPSLYILLLFRPETGQEAFNTIARASRSLQASINCFVA